MKGIIFSFILLAIGLWFYNAYFLVTIFSISFLIFFHELGHYSVARLFGVGVEKFSIGFGDKIYGKKIGSTMYQISAIPLGGYVQLKGQNDAKPMEKSQDKDSYNLISPIKKIAILFAGPAFNFILAFFLFIWIGIIGNEKLAPVVGKILPNSASSEILKNNDEILKINDVKILYWDQIGQNIKEGENNILIKRDNKIINLKISPKLLDSKNIFGENIKKYLIGISPNGKTIKINYSGLNLIKFAFDETKNASLLLLTGIGKIISGVVPLDQLGGIVQITDLTSRAASINLVTLLSIVALISVNLGLLNLMPIPALDGGHIVFNAYELIFRRPVGDKIFAIFNYIGIAFLLLLMTIATFNDFYRIFKGH